MIAINKAGLAKSIIRDATNKASTKNERNSRRFFKIGAPM